MGIDEYVFTGPDGAWKTRLKMSPTRSWVT